MRQKSVPTKEPAEEVIKGIRRATRRHFSAEDKIRIVLEGLRGEASIAELCRREGIVQNRITSRPMHQTKTQESRLQNQALLQNRILAPRYTGPPLSRFQILHGRLDRAPFEKPQEATGVAQPRQVPAQRRFSTIPSRYTYGARAVRDQDGGLS